MSKESGEDLLESLTAERSENERLRGRQKELLALIAKLTRETPYPAELDECRSARSALIAEVGTLRAKVSEFEDVLAADRLHETSEQFVGRCGIVS